MVKIIYQRKGHSWEKCMTMVKGFCHGYPWNNKGKLFFDFDIFAGARPD